MGIGLVFCTKRYAKNKTWPQYFMDCNTAAQDELVELIAKSAFAKYGINF
jgi:hypothetical protein